VLDLLSSEDIAAVLTDAWRVLSPGTAPAAQVHPEVIAAMAEVGLALRNAAPQLEHGWVRS
jgi:protein-tyrosine-phosphatase